MTTASASAQAEIGFEEFQRIFGPIRALSPTEVLALFADAPFRWWIAGGWSVDRGPTPRRFHEDIEVAVPKRDVAELRVWLRAYHLWDTNERGIHHLAPDVELPPDREQIWVRRDAYSPWLVDLMLTPVDDDTWIYKRDARVTRPLDAVIRIGADGVPYQRPEVTLLYKSRRRSAKDEADFAAVGPTLAAADRAWLRTAIALTEPPGHPWLDQLG
jgi:hypothetical protein